MRDGQLPFAKIIPLANTGEGEGFEPRRCRADAKSRTYSAGLILAYASRPCWPKGCRERPPSAPIGRRIYGVLGQQCHRASLLRSLNDPARAPASRPAGTDGRVVGATVEARSAFARLVRDRELNSAQRATAIALLGQLRRSWDEILPTEAVCAIAESLPDEYGVRAGDAWQLAAARYGAVSGLVVGRLCLDKRLAKAASAMGFMVHPN